MIDLVQMAHQPLPIADSICLVTRTLQVVLPA